MAVGVPCGEINTIDKVFENPQMQHLGMAWDVDSQERGKSKLVGPADHPERFEGVDHRARRQPLASTPVRCWANLDMTARKSMNLKLLA